MVEKCLGNRGLPWDGLDSKIGRLEANMFEPDGFSCGVGSFRKCLECTNVKRSVKRYNIGSRWERAREQQRIGLYLVILSENDTAPQLK